MDGAFSFLGQFFPGLTFTRKPVFGGKVPLNFPLEPLDRLFVRLDMQTQFLFDGCMGARFLFNSLIQVRRCLNQARLFLCHLYIALRQLKALEAQAVEFVFRL